MELIKCCASAALRANQRIGLVKAKRLECTEVFYPHPFNLLS